MTVCTANSVYKLIKAHTYSDPYCLAALIMQSQVMFDSIGDRLADIHAFMHLFPSLPSTLTSPLIINERACYHACTYKLESYYWASLRSLLETPFKTLRQPSMNLLRAVRSP